MSGKGWSTRWPPWCVLKSVRVRAECDSLRSEPRLHGSAVHAGGDDRHVTGRWNLPAVMDVSWGGHWLPFAARSASGAARPGAFGGDETAPFLAPNPAPSSALGSDDCVSDSCEGALLRLSRPWIPGPDAPYKLPYVHISECRPGVDAVPDASCFT